MNYRFLYGLIFTVPLLFVACQNSQQLPPGIPDRSSRLDVLPGFRNPPPGYGEIPFWWWSGDTLNTERMISQLRELHKKSISGVQVNYSHHDSPGWLTDQDDPAIFSEDWWRIFSSISQECAGLNMGIGLSTYTIDWPRGADNLFFQLFYHKPELNAIGISFGVRRRVKGGERISIELTSAPVTLVTSSWAEESEYLVAPQRIAVLAYPIHDNKIQKGGMDLNRSVSSCRLEWTAPPGEWEVWEFLAVRRPGTLNPLLAGSGNALISGFFQPFEDRVPGRSSKGLNYFFNDELHIGEGRYAWNPDFADEFRKRKGYDLMDFLPAMWEDIGKITPRVRMDYADVRMALMEERYFRPVYEWHASRGMIFGCDSESRGLDPGEFGDYFRATRWYTAPGHDTPGGKADLIKGKVSSSIANLYKRPRVWLEGYHSLGWGATPEQMMHATRENYLYGCTLLNLHGLYYTTYGSFWEWAPPCYHFRMPYWAHMDLFLRYFERLSYLLSQGHLVNDVAVVYPVTPYEAGMGGDRARDTAFALGRSFAEAGISFEFIDNESLARAVVDDGLLKVEDAGAVYRALVFPGMSAVRWQSIEKAAAFAKGGGKVYAVGTLPTASDRAGRDDAELIKMNEIAFAPGCRMTTVDQTVDAISNAFVQDVKGTGKTVRALHRKAGFRDVYMVMDARPGTVVEFRAKGAVELWDPWTGNVSPLRVTGETLTGTQVELPLEEYEANIVVFTPGRKHMNPPSDERTYVKEITLPEEWKVAFIPTMDNTWGDFRMPVTAENKLIGPEARRFAWSYETEALEGTAMVPATDDSLWEKKLHGFGTQFYLLSPVPGDVDRRRLEAEIARLESVDPSVPVIISGRTLTWYPYDFSWRYGKEGDHGHQGYHGLKRTVTDDFLCLGMPVPALNEIRYTDESEGMCYYLWSCVTVEKGVTADVCYSKGPPADRSHTSPILTPSVMYLNGVPVPDLNRGIELKAGSNPLLVRYDHAGRGHLVLRRHGIPLPSGRQPLSMKWSDDKGVIPFDVTAGRQPAEWFRFITAPGTSALKVMAYGEVEAWIDGAPMIAEKNGRFKALEIPAKAAVVALRVRPGSPGISGGSLIPEPVLIETDGSGIMTPGDWSKTGILNNYSGGIRYKTTITMTAADSKAEITLDLGKVAGTAEVTVNGRQAGVRVAPPWKLDVSGLFKKGENTIEVLVYNTLSNHYQTIPSNYRGDPVSGLLGPVKLLL